MTDLADIVAYIRWRALILSEMHRVASLDTPDAAVQSLFDRAELLIDVADAIERGEHVGRTYRRL
jgi:hypothetical protein